MENKNKEIGALWEKTSKAGNKFKTGYIQLEGGERIEIVAFVNQYKKSGDNTPDLRIYLSEQRGTGNEKPQGKTTQKTVAPKTKPQETSPQEEADEIPF